MTHDVRLEGCRSEPLAAYLKALGVLRLIGEQADSAARGWWEGDSFVLRSTFDEDALVDFFVDDYCPTPIVSPWNGGSGFKEEKNPAAVAALRAVEFSELPRLGRYRDAIGAARLIYESTRGLPKELVVLRCRNELPEEAVRWIDSTVVLSGSGEVYPPLLGTGGNDGRFDFSKAFLERLSDVLCLRPGKGAPDRKRALTWLCEGLLGGTETALLNDVIGQFDPGAAGGANSSPVGGAPSLVNPWDWVLLVEGALLFAAAAARRLGGAHGRGSVPFTFNAMSVGFGTAANENTRGELWAPLWVRPTTATEVAHFIGEGRADWAGHQARSALDAARAVATLGTDRGIGTFVRHGFIERNGLATTAVVLGRQRPSNALAVPVAAQLDVWLDRVRRAGRAPAAVDAALRGVERALFAHANRPGIVAMQQVLVAAAVLEDAVGRSTTFRGRTGLGPLHGLAARDWLRHLDDGSVEFDLARSLASQRDTDGSSLRRILEPITVVNGRLEWVESTAPISSLGIAALEDALAAALQRRAIDRVQSDRVHGDRAVGARVAYDFAVSARPSSVLGLLDGEIDTARWERLTRALLVLDWRAPVELAPRDDARGVVFPPAFAVLSPFFARQPVQIGDREMSLRADPSWPRLLAAGRVASVLDGAVRRLRGQRWQVRIASIDVVAAAAPSGPRLAAALLCPLPRSAVARALSISARSGDEVLVSRWEMSCPST
ncbi:MAG: type I-G CRISPR-associated protein Cas8g1/Csx17 [Actinomycetota bacterium]